MTGMEKAVNAIFAHGEKVSAAHEDKVWSFRAFIEPVNVRSPEEDEALPEGVYDGRRYTLLASCDAFSGTEVSAQISAKSGEYELVRLEKMPSGHWEGIMRRKAGADA